MKILNLLFLVAILSVSRSTLAQKVESVQIQDVEKSWKFTLSSDVGIGYASIESETEPSYNLNSIRAAVLLKYNFQKFLGVATGIAFNNLSGNGFKSVGNFYQERELLQVPFIITFDNRLSDNLESFFSIGIYGQNILSDDYRFLNSTQGDIYQGWNIGWQSELGFLFSMSDRSQVGIKYLRQSDFGNFESDGDLDITDEQKMSNLRSIGIIYRFKL